MGRRTWSSSGVLLLIIIIIICRCRTSATTLESILWSSSNPQFSPGHGLVLYPQIGDKMDIVCPRSGASPGGKEEFYRVYLVSRGQMDGCIVDKMDTPLLNCDKPNRDVKFTFKFQEFSPNLWGLEFLRGRDYYITSTSTGSLQGLDNTNGGVCRTKSMKLMLRVGQNSSDPPSTLQESPTRFPPMRPKSKDKDASEKKKHDPSDSETQRLVWILSTCVLVLLLVTVTLVLLWRHRRRHFVPGRRQSASVSLNTVAVPKRDSISSDNNGSDHSDVVFPLRPSEGMICRHYERVSGDYGAPVYIVQEVTPASTPTNIYYKV